MAWILQSTIGIVDAIGPDKDRTFKTSLKPFEQNPIDAQGTCLTSKDWQGHFADPRLIFMFN